MAGNVRRSTRQRGETNYKEPSMKDFEESDSEQKDKSRKRKNGSKDEKEKDEEESEVMEVDEEESEDGGDDDDDEEMKEEDDEEEVTVRRSKRTKTSTTTTTTTTDDDSILKTPKAKKSSNSSRAHHSTERRSLQKSESGTDSDADYMEEEEEEEGAEDETESEDDSFSELQIKKVIGSKTVSMKEWRDIMKKMNTTEVENGQRLDSGEALKDLGDDEMVERFLILWDDVGFLHCSWETKHDIIHQVVNGKRYITIFSQKNIDGCLYDIDERGDGEYFDPAYLQVERILEVVKPERQKDGQSTPTKEQNWGIVLDPKSKDFEDGTGRQLLIKWTNLPYEGMTYEFERDLILLDIDYEDHLKDYEKRETKPTKSEMKKKGNKEDYQSRRLYKIFGDQVAEGDKKSKLIAEYKKDAEEKVYKNGGQLRDYQAEGVSWLISNYINDRSSILADEMGLGKTLQTAVYVDTILSDLHKPGPVLIIAPLSTLPHWQREFLGWTDLNTVVYHGSARDRQLIRSFEFAYETDRPAESSNPNQRYLHRCHKKKAAKWERTWQVDVVITTPETLVCDDFTELTAISWELLVVDEAHRLKNHTSRLGTNLRDSRFDFNSILLLTGTPIQNNMKELWTLMNMIEPDEFDDSEDFLEKYGNMKDKESVDSLHESIKPYILRRLKEDVEKKVPPKEETLIEVELTVLQKQYYRALYEKNVGFLHRNKKKALDGPSLNNLAMQLRKCCNHPFLLNGVESEIRKSSSDSEADFLINASGKLVLLDKLLPKLREGGHRVLIFSQFKIMLDILEDYLDIRKFKHERIDGSITGSKRQMAIDRFQAKESLDSSFIMLLSTRAGGVGINLTAADTCIIFDSDWNPQNDLQAQARCHRIGQTKSVKVYRLLTRKTYELQMFHMSSLKMGLDQAVLQGIEKDAEGAMTKEEIENLLRHGAYEIFTEEKQDASEKESKEFCDQDIDSILARRTKTVVHENTGSQSSAAGGTFSKASFNATSKSSSSNADGDIDIDDPDFWKKMIGEEHLNKEEGVFSSRKARRSRTKIKNYSDDLVLKDVSDSSEEEDASSDSDDSAFVPRYNSYEFFFGTNALQVKAQMVQRMLDAGREIKPIAERSTWGGDSETEWSKFDAMLMNELLQKMGMYSSTGVNADMFLNQFKSLASKKYSNIEIQRMATSIYLTALREAVDEDFNTTLKRYEQRLARQANESAEASSSHATPEWKEKQLTASFQKVWCLNSSVLSNVWSEALRLAKDLVPRVETDEILTTMKRKFYEQVWPKLEALGWEDKKGPDNQPSFCYSKDNKKIKCTSVCSVVDAAINQDPDSAPPLMDFVATVTPMLMLVCPSSQRKKFESATLQNMSFDLLKNYIKTFAPAQLLADRDSARRALALNSKLLNILKYMHNAHDFISKVGSDGGRYETLARLIPTKPTWSIPHLKWGVLHDAGLIDAIAKHGWLEFDGTYQAITEDTEIKWEAPFGRPDTDMTPGYNKDEHISVAKRVESFFNNDYDDFKDANQNMNYDLLRKCYGIHADESTKKWKMEASDIRNTSSEVETLPSRTALVRRARLILALAPKPGNSSPSKETETTMTSKYGLTILDQTNICNVFLSELLNAALKGAKKDRGDLTISLLSRAMEETQLRHESKHATDPVRKEMQNIYNHISLVHSHPRPVSREAKNVLRVVLGFEPIPSSTGDKLFPFSQQSPINAPLNGMVMNKLNNRSGNDSASGDFALNKAFIVESQPNKSSECFRISEIEALILSIVLSQGLPVYDDNWKHFLGANAPVNVNPLILTWNGMGTILEVSAKQWLHATKQKLAPSLSNNGEANDPEATKQLESKEFNLVQAKRFNQDPILLAKKTIMLLEALRLFAIQQAGQRKRANAKSQGPGTFVLQWYRNHLVDWAKALDVLSGDTVQAWSEIDFMTDVYDKPIGALEKTSARDVVNQISQMTRLRSIYISRNAEEFSMMISKSLRNVDRKGPNYWKTRPRWWVAGSDDKALIEGLLQFGFGGFDEIIMGASFYPRIAVDQMNSADVNTPNDFHPFTRLSAQNRVDSITKELNNVDTIERNLSLSMEVRQGGGFAPSMGNNTVQTGIAAYFAQTRGVPNSSTAPGVSGSNIVVIQSESD